MKKNLIRCTAVILATAVITAAVTYHLKYSHRHEKKTAVKNVVVEKTQKTEVTGIYEASGTVKAKNVSVIASRVMGTVTAVFVRQGDSVRTGQELLNIENNDLATRLDGAEAAHNEAKKSVDAAQESMNLAETTYKRYKRLSDEKAISAQEMDQIENQKKMADINFQQAQAAVQKAQGGLDEAKVNMSFSHVTSPIDGIVTQKNIDAGSTAMVGMVLMTIEDISGFKVEADIDEHLTEQISISMPVEIVIDAISASFKAKISSVVPSMDASSRTFMIKAVIENEPNQMPSLKTGLYAKILIPQGRKTILAVPLKAVVEKGQLTGVYAVDNGGNVNYRLVRTGKIYGGKMEILSGLNEGEDIIVANVENAADGGTIEDWKK